MGRFSAKSGANAESEKNDEARMTNDEGMTKHEARQQMVESDWSFDYLALFRHSTFGFRHFAAAAQPRSHMLDHIISELRAYLISVAPSIKRAKSYVTRLLSIAPLNPLRIRSAASVQPM